MNLPQWAQSLLGGIAPNGVIATLLFFVLTTLVLAFRAIAAGKQIRVLGTKVQLLDRERANLEQEKANLEEAKANLEKERELNRIRIEGETEEHARNRLSANRKAAQMDLEIANAALERIDGKLAAAELRRKELEAMEEQTKQERAARNESLKRVRTELATIEEQIADYKKDRLEPHEKVEDAMRIIKNIGLEQTRLSGRPKPVEKSPRR